MTVAKYRVTEITTYRQTQNDNYKTVVQAKDENGNKFALEIEDRELPSVGMEDEIEVIFRRK